MVFHEDNILNAYNYETLCDYSIVPPYNKFFSSEILKNDFTIFCKTDFIDYLFHNIEHSKYNYNLLTHHSDYSIDEEKWNKKPKCIKKWFAINPIVKNPNLIPIPLGLKTHKGDYLEPKYMTSWFCENISRLKNIKKNKNIYCNWNSTNLERNLIIQKLIYNNIKYTHQFSIPFNEYIENMAEHKFVISPIGNGIDCHRTWEALYIGCIPIVIKNYIYDVWDLPVLQVNDYSEITQELLDNFKYNKNNLDLITIDFWKNYIKL